MRHTRPDFQKAAAAFVMLIGRVKKNCVSDAGRILSGSFRKPDIRVKPAGKSAPEIPIAALFPEHGANRSDLALQFRLSMII